MKNLSLFYVHSLADAEEIKACPRCGAYIMKTNDGSCNRMNCTVCACQFCWLCMQEITDVHYLRYPVSSVRLYTYNQRSASNRLSVLHTHTDDDTYVTLLTPHRSVAHT